MQPLAFAVVGIPFAGAILCLAVRDKAAKTAGIIVTSLTALAAVYLCAQLPNETRLFGNMPWLGARTAKGLFGYQLDPLACIMLLVCTVIGVAIAIYSAGYLSGNNRDHACREGYARYYFWLLAFIGSMVGIAISPTLLQLLIFWEMTTLCSWALISFYDNEESLKAGMKALIMTSFGGLFFMGGLVWLFAATGSTSFDALGLMSPGQRAGVFALLLVAAWAKSAQVPFHTWLPDAMAAPTPISAYLHAAAMVKAGVFLIARLVASGWHLPYGMSMLVSIAALVTMFAALFLYFFQDDLKRLLAYSTIAQLGFILLGLGLGALGGESAYRGAVLHIMMHGCAKTLLFLTVGVVAYVAGTRSISALSGISRSLPIAAVSFFLGAVALAGVPPLACFWSKLYVLQGALQVKGAFGPLVFILLLVETLISFGWFLWVGQKVFLGQPKKAPRSRAAKDEANSELATAGAADPPLSMNAVLVAMCVLTLLVPIVGIPLVQKLIVP